MAAGSAGELGRRHGLEQIGFWSKLVAHPAYDAFWQAAGRGQDAGRRTAESAHACWCTACGTRKTSTAHRRSIRRSSPKTKATTWCSWCSAVASRAGNQRRQQSGRAEIRQRYGECISASRFSRRFWHQYLKDGAPKADIAPVTAFETGTNKWLRLPSWPAGCPSGCAVMPTPLYLQAGLKLSFDAPQGRRRSIRGVCFRSGEARAVSARGRFNRSDIARDSPGHNGWLTISARLRAVPMLSRLPPIF